MIPMDVRRCLAALLAGRGVSGVAAVDLLERGRILAGALRVRDFADEGLAGEPADVSIDDLGEVIGEEGLVLSFRRSAADAAEVMERLFDRAERHVVVVLDEPGRTLSLRGAIDEDLDLDVAPVPSSASTLVVTDELGDVTRLTAVTLPRSLAVDVPPRGGRITFAIESGHAFATPARTIELPVAAEGRTVRIEVSAKPGDAGDHLIVRCPAEPRARVVATIAPCVVDGPVDLEVCFDATMFDLSAFAEVAGGAAVARAPEWLEGLGDDPVDERPEARPASDWNAEVRAEAFAAVRRAASALPRGSRVATSWFADRVRPGGVQPAHPDACSEEACGFLGERPSDDLGDLASHPAVGYRSGLDLVDAVDEVLAEVASRVTRERRAGRRRVVVVIGDSPPPPSPEPEDPLWQLATSPRRVGTRVSTTLDRALGELATAGVPVVHYAFLAAASRGVELDATLRTFVDLQRRVASALGRRKGLRVLEADRTEASIVDAIRSAVAFRPAPRLVGEEVAR